VDAKAITSHKHPFGYKEQAELCSDKLYLEYAAKAKVVIAMHSVYKPCDFKRLFVFHGGTAYRRNHLQINEFFNRFADGAIIQNYGLLGKGAKNEHWLPPPIELYESDYTYHGTRFAHYPNKPGFKGTVNIMAAFEECHIPVDYKDQFVPHAEYLKRISGCDIYVEQLTTGWGMTALEAASLGKIVITSFRGVEEYERQFGKCEIMVALTKDELKERIKEVYKWTPKQILEKKKATRKWAETYHSFEAVGKRLKEIIGL